MRRTLLTSSASALSRAPARSLSATGRIPTHTLTARFDSATFSAASRALAAALTPPNGLSIAAGASGGSRSTGTRVVDCARGAGRREIARACVNGERGGRGRLGCRCAASALSRRAAPRSADSMRHANVMRRSESLQRSSTVEQPSTTQIKWRPSRRALDARQYPAAYYPR
jgi:hypothetical protein